MADRSRKIAAKRLKREKKRKAARRAEAGSPILRAQHWPLHECVMVEHEGMQSIYVSRTGPTGLMFAAFLIDKWCAGLKDAFGEMTTLTDWEEVLAQRSREFGLTEQTIPIEQAAEAIEAGVRFANRNGFKLPRNWEKWCAFAGATDFANADLSGFGFEGGLHWVGTVEDLSRRLSRCSVQEFLARPDVTTTLRLPSEHDIPFDAEGEPEIDELDEESVSNALQSIGTVAGIMVEAVRQHCDANGVDTSHRVADVVAAIMFATALSGDPQDVDAIEALIERWVLMQPPHEWAALRLAEDQVQETMAQFPDLDAREEHLSRVAADIDADRLELPQDSLRTVSRQMGEIVMEIGG